MNDGQGGRALGWPDGVAFVVALVFLAAGIDKTLRFWEFLKVLSAYAVVPSRYIVLVAVLVILGELASAILLVPRGTRAVGACLAGVLAAVFLEVSILARLTGYAGECGCFRFQHASAGGWVHIGENVVLVSLCAILVFTSRQFRDKLVRFGRGLRWVGIVAVLLVVDVLMVTVLLRVRSGGARERPAASAATGSASRRVLSIRADRVPTLRVLAEKTISAEDDRNLAFGKPKTIRFVGPDRLIVLDVYNNRVVQLDTSGRFIGQFGAAGKGPGEFKNPWALDVDRLGNIYVADPGNARVSIFSAAGRFLKSFPTDGVGESVAVDSRGNIYMNEPGRGKLIAVYRPDGRLVTTFGELLPYQKPAPPLPGAVNTVVFDTDSRDNLWLAFQLHPKPEIRKYGPAHELLFRAKLEVPEVEKELKTYNVRASGMVYPIFANDLYVDEQDRVWVLLNFQSALYRFRPDGTPDLRVIPVDPNVRSGWYLLGGVAVRRGRLWASAWGTMQLVRFRLGSD